MYFRKYFKHRTSFLLSVQALSVLLGILVWSPQLSATEPQAAQKAKAESVLDLQPFLTRQRMANSQGDEVSLININPNVGAWYILDVNMGGKKGSHHLEVCALGGDPANRPRLTLYRDGLTVGVPNEVPRYYPLWATAESGFAGPAGPVPGEPDELNPSPVLSEILESSHAVATPLTPICDGLVLVRHQMKGAATRLEGATDLLRETRFGEWFVATAKPYLIDPPDFEEDHTASSANDEPGRDAFRPIPAKIDESQGKVTCSASKIGIETDVGDKEFGYGKWYQAVGHPGVYVSVMKVSVVNKAIMDTYKDRVGAIGKHDTKKKEADALVYLTAFDMSQFRFGFAVGADHPSLEWSSMAVAVTKKGKGPDGFDSKAPLATVGVLPPYFSSVVEATFVGGFKRKQGAFGSGPLAKVNNGSHFGFAQDGAIFSSLNRELSTAVIKRDGSLDLITWPEDASALLPDVVHVRQNCVAVIEGRDSSGVSIPGKYVNQYGPGSWSGDQKGEIVTLRSGIAIQETDQRRFLIFGYFTGATPNAMARVFQAYQCRYAMLLDMNTPNFCHIALYDHDATGTITGAECLHKEMTRGNGEDGSLKFIEKNDTRDFFYVLRKTP